MAWAKVATWASKAPAKRQHRASTEPAQRQQQASAQHVSKMRQQKASAQRVSITRQHNASAKSVSPLSAHPRITINLGGPLNALHGSSWSSNAPDPSKSLKFIRTVWVRRRNCQHPAGECSPGECRPSRRHRWI